MAAAAPLYKGDTVRCSLMRTVRTLLVSHSRSLCTRLFYPRASSRLSPRPLRTSRFSCCRGRSSRASSFATTFFSASRRVSRLSRLFSSRLSPLSPSAVAATAHSTTRGRSPLLLLSSLLCLSSRLVLVSRLSLTSSSPSRPHLSSRLAARPLSHSTSIEKNFQSTANNEKI